MIKEIRISVAACALVAAPLAFAQSSLHDWRAPGATTSSGYGQAYDEGNAVKTEQINLGEEPVAAPAELTEVQLPEAALERLAGKYTAQNKSSIVVARVGNHLAADLAGMSLEFSPRGPNEFFIPGSPLTLSFVSDQTGKAQALVVRENGMAIIEATAPR
ncbi:MAG TPA: hypothetical protein VF861_00485 [Telluria sp.]